MSDSTQMAGRVVTLWRYPIKSMIGEEVRLGITGPCPRCVMTTLPQADLPADHGILRTAARHHQVNVGVYASVLQGGTMRRGDLIRVE